MKRLLARFCVLLGALFVLTGARDPILVPEVSQHEIAIEQGFTGANLLLFGAILSPEGTRLDQDYDIVVVVEGPTRPLLLREKRRIAGVWINADSTAFRSVPSFYAVASSRPIRQIIDGNTAAIYELGLASLQLSPSGAIDPAAQAHFAAGLVDLMRRQGIYSEQDHAVAISGQVLYRARIVLPSNVQTGTYTAETFAITHGKVVASAISRVVVNKLGVERAIADFARHDALAYGLIAVALSAAMGWLAGRLFALG